ncbi:hypothetical protein GL409_25495 [Salmonella enterica]|nr:hypothetical protein [Salmonella enterica]
MVLTVTSAQYPRPGERHVYIMNNGSVVLPGNVRPRSGRGWLLVVVCVMSWY